MAKRQRQKKTVAIVLKATLSIALFAFIFWKVDLASVKPLLLQLSGWLIASVVALMALQTFVGGVRWWLILRHLNIQLRLITALRITLIGTFFNQLLPSSVGGDVVRAWSLYRMGKGKSIAVISVLSDRLFGMAGLVILSALLFPVVLNMPVASATKLSLAVTITATLLLITSAVFLDRVPGLIRRWPVIRHLGHFSQVNRILVTDRGINVVLFMLSIVIQGITVFAIILLITTVASQANLWLCATLIPLIILIASMPVSIAGWGVREGVMIFGLGLANVPAKSALLASIAFGLTLTLIGAFGGMIWVFETLQKGPRRKRSC